LQDSLLQVVAEQRIGTVFPVRHRNGHRELVEVYRTDMPWGRPPPEGTDWTSDADIRNILESVDIEV
jgi:hypothetical protein